MDDVLCDKFVQENFSAEFHQMYKDLPLGVMRADVWRVAVVYAYGGVYADIDTECVTSIGEWCKGQLTVAEETSDGNIANYAFAATARHPALESVLNNMMEKWENKTHFNSESKTPVQDFGQHAFDYGIKQYKASFSDRINIIPFKEKRFTNFKLPSTFVWHQVASIAWKQDYTRWRDQENQLLNMLK